jgi:hypothetical protein
MACLSLSLERKKLWGFFYENINVPRRANSRFALLIYFARDLKPGGNSRDKSLG